MIPGSSIQIDIVGQVDNNVLVDAGTFFSTDLADGSFVGATPNLSMNWAGGGVISACTNAGGLVCIGNFLGGVGYLGVEFDIDGATHYGWVEIESRQFLQFVSVQRWAYESEPGVRILAGRIPEPSAIALLLTSLSLATKRRRVDLRI